MKNLIISISFILTTIGGLHAQKTGQTTDSRDGKTYSTVIIGDQTWMAENLDYDAGEGSADYDDKPENSKIYGLLYVWEAAKTACPKGWHLPKDSEWDQLVMFLGGPLVAGAKLKEKGNAHWKEPNKATNESGFSSLPGGLRYDYGDYNYISKVASFWSSTESTGLSAIYKKLRNASESLVTTDDLLIAGHSVRCLKN